MNYKGLLLAFMAAVSFTANPPTENGGDSPSPAKGLPMAEDLIENHLKARGGRKSLDRMKSRREKMRTVYPHAPGAWTLTIEESNIKNQRLTHYTRADGTTESTGYDGAIAWVIRDNNPEILRGLDAARLILFSKIYEFKDGINEATSTRVTGPITFHNYKCYQLNVEHRSGLDLSFYFQVDTGFCTGVKYQIIFEGDIIEVERTLENYQKTNGIRFARKSVAQYYNQSTKVRWKTITRSESIEINVEYGGKHFDLPPSVKALAENHKEATRK